jgi:hypothetical protein
MYVDRFRSLGITKGPEVVKLVCNCPIAQRLLEIRDATKDLIGFNCSHLNSLVYIQNRVYKYGKLIVVEKGKEW